MVALLIAAALCVSSEIDLDERVIFFPSLGRWVDDGATAELLISGWVFEPENRVESVDWFVRHSGLDEVLKGDSQADRSLLAARAAAFLVDNERGQRIAFRIGEHVLTCEPSTPDGRFEGRFRISRKALGAGIDPKAAFTLTIEAVTRTDDPRRFAGQVRILPSTGISVISDIDDTIRVSNVRDKVALLRGTFLMSWRGVPGMAARYAEWHAAADAEIHYLSAGPTPLIEPLVDFLKQEGFPAGSIHLRRFRLKEEPIFALDRVQEEHKRRVIEQLLEFYPKRRFVLIGDSGERDPEIYGEIGRATPGRIERILIRDVTDEAADAPRYQAAFRDLSAERWRLFKDADRLSIRP